MTAVSNESGVVTGEIWEQFCDQLRAAGEQILRPETLIDAGTKAEGFAILRNSCGLA